MGRLKFFVSVFCCGVVFGNTNCTKLTDEQRKASSTLENIKAYVIKMDKEVFGLKSLEKAPRTFIPSNLSSEFRQDSLKVIFSGKYIPSKGARLRGVPIEIIEIRTLKD